MEVWKQVDGWPYLVSSLGNVKSLHTGKNLAKSIDSSGYEKVNLKCLGNCQTANVHRLVAVAFLQNTNDYPTVNHKDHNRTNNSIDNLEWMTYADNNLHARKTPSISEEEFMHCLVANVTIPKTAAAIGCSRKTVYNIAKRFGI